MSTVVISNYLKLNVVLICTEFWRPNTRYLNSEIFLLPSVLSTVFSHLLFTTFRLKNKGKTFYIFLSFQFLFTPHTHTVLVHHSLARCVLEYVWISIRPYFCQTPHNSSVRNYFCLSFYWTHSLLQNPKNYNKTILQYGLNIINWNAKIIQKVKKKIDNIDQKESRINKVLYKLVQGTSCKNIHIFINHLLCIYIFIKMGCPNRFFVWWKFEYKIIDVLQHHAE